MEKSDKVDLHIHTTFSNGKDSLIDVLKQAEENGVKVISITDYNTLKSYIELMHNIDVRKFYSGQIVVGLEVRCRFIGENGQEKCCDMLGYNISLDKIEQMQEWLLANTDKDKSISEQIKQLQHFKTVAKELGLKFDEDLALNPDNDKAGMAMIQNILKYYEENIGLWPELERYRKEPTSAWQEVFTNPNNRFYWNMSQYCPKIEDFIELVHNSGGLVFTAHPFAYVSDSKKTEEQATHDLIRYVEHCLTLGVDGVECFNQYNCSLIPHAIPATRYLKQYCLEKGIRISGGTDYHQREIRTTGVGVLGSDSVQNAEEYIPWENKKKWAFLERINCDKSVKEL